MEAKNKYYKVTVLYKRESKIPTSTHIVKAISPKKAVLLANRHNISNTMNPDLVISRKAKVLDMSMDFNKLMIFNRRKGINGSIWLEDESGNLLKEVDNL